MFKEIESVDFQISTLHIMLLLEFQTFEIGIVRIDELHRGIAEFNPCKQQYRVGTMSKLSREHYYQKPSPTMLWQDVATC